MADPRTFTLIGEFKDGITPELEKINKQLTTLKSNFAGVGSRKNTGFRGATQEIGKLVSAHKNLANSIKSVQSELRSTVGVLQQYRSEMRKAAAATHAFQKSGGSLGSTAFTKNMRAANREAKAYLRTLQQISSQHPRTMPRPGGAGMGRGGGAPLTSRGGRGGGERPGMGAGGFHMAEFGFAYTLGAAIANPIQNAIVTGFQIGVGFMTRPFEYFAGAFGERVQDQLSDLKAAGGLLSISKRSKTPFLSTMDEAIQFQQDTNRVFANMAKDLPGVTNDYVQVGKRLSDTMGRITAGDFQNALQEANRIRATEEGRKFYVKPGESAEITGTGPEAQKKIITTLLGEMTKKTTLAGLGGQSGAGGITGAYGLPGLTERMLAQQKVSTGQFQRYAAVFSDPTISDALSRNVDLINKTLPNTTARFRAMQKLLDEVVTPEMIEKLRTSVDGVYQGLKSTFFDPDTGLFGLGRQFTDFGYQIDQYGRYVVDKAGKKIKQDLSIFEIIADIFSTAGQVFLPLAEALPLVFDPLKKVANILMDARHYAAQFATTFNEYREGLKLLSQQKGKEFLKGTIDLRASLGAINNVLLQVGAIGKGDFEQNAKLLLEGKGTKFIGPMISNMVDQLLNSKAAAGLGEMIGQIVGTVISEVAKVTGFISGRIAKSNELFKGLKKGFEAAGGPAAFTNIFKDVFSSIGKVLLSIAKILPFQAYLLAAAMVVLPAAIQGLAMAIASSLGGAIFGLANKVNPLAQIMMTRAAAAQGLGRRGRQFGTYQGRPQRYGAGGSIERLNRMRRYKMGQTAQFAGEAIDLGYNYAGRPGAKALGRFRKGIGKVGKFVPGGALAAGAVDMGLALASGENFGKAAAGTIGTVLGGTVGTIFGPAGTAIGSIAGGLIGDAVANAFTGPGYEQRAAANQQKFAAEMQTQAAKLRAGGLGEQTQYAFGTAKQFGQRLEALGLGGTMAGLRLETAYGEREKAADAAKQLADQLKAKIASMTAAEIPPAEIAAVVRPLQAQSDAAAKTLKEKQAAFTTTLGSMPKEIKTKVLNSFSNLSFKGAEAIVNSKFAAMQFTPPPFAGLTLGQQSYLPPPNPNPGVPPSLSAFRFYNGNNNRRMGLGSAIASELKHKPPGSDLVIANSSETIIPAANGHIPPSSLYSRRGSASGSSPISVSAPITIYQQPGQSADELASIVAIKIGEAMADARAASIFV